MAFKSINQVKAEKYAGKFILENDGDSAFVIFLYRSSNDMLAADTHYIKSNEYNGYVHCLGDGCPACAKGLRIQTKLFVPMYVLAINGVSVNEIQFWDRNMRFEPVLSQSVFKNYADPSAYIFKITRNGAHGSKETTYSIAVADTNKVSFDQIMADNKAVFPDYYEHVVKSADATTISKYLASAATSNNATASEIPAYVATPRASVEIPGVPFDTSDVLVEVADDPDEEITDEVDFG